MNMKKLILILAYFLFFSYCKKENDCFKIEIIIEIDGRYFFYWWSISLANIDSETPLAMTGEVSESDFNHTQKGTNIVLIKYIKYVVYLLLN